MRENTRQHWDQKSVDEILDHFDEFQDLRTLEALLQEAPQALKDFMSTSPKDPKAAIARIAELNRQKNDRLLEKAGLQKPAKKGKGWHVQSINSQVAAICRSNVN